MEKRIIENVKIGADPEMFLYSPDKECFIPVCGLVGGTKEEPLLITNEGHALQEDNVMLEFCIPPSTTVDEFYENIKYVKDHIDNKVLASLGLVSKCVASAEFKPNDLMSEQAQLFGWNTAPYLSN